MTAEMTPPGAPSQSRSPLQIWIARCEFWGFNMFTASMGTGGVSILIGGCPYAFRGQRALGTVWLMLNLVVFMINVAGIATRAVCHPVAFKRAVYSHEDGLYLPCINLAAASLYVGVVDFGLPYCGFALTRVWHVLWFVYLGVALGTGMFMETTCRGRLRSLSTITPADALPVFPLMLGGVLGSTLGSKLPDHEAAHVIIISYCCQGMGWWLSILKLGVWMRRNMTYPHPPTRSLPGYLMAVGPAGYTSFAFINLGSLARTAFPAANILGGEEAGRVFFYCSVWFALLLWGTCWWLILSPLYLLIVGSVRDRKVEWSLGWWSFTFPLVGFWSAAGQFGVHLPSTTFKSIQVAGLFITLVFWCINSFMMGLYIWQGKLLVATEPFEVAVLVRRNDGERMIFEVPSAEGLRNRGRVNVGEEKGGHLNNTVGLEA